MFIISDRSRRKMKITIYERGARVKAIDLSLINVRFRKSVKLKRLLTAGYTRNFIETFLSA
jgi:hypothetical protein